MSPIHYNTYINVITYYLHQFLNSSDKPSSKHYTSKGYIIHIGNKDIYMWIIDIYLYI